MPARRTAYILGGGASRGAYQAGCIKRLDEEGIVPDLVVGSSIGVLNALVYETGGPEGLWALWSRAFSLPRIFDASLRRNALLGNSLFSIDRLARFVESEIDFERCFESPRELTFVVANLTEGRAELRGNRTEEDVEHFRSVVRAGYTIPVLHPLVDIDGDLYADGGFLWNVPFEYAQEWGATDLHVLSMVPSELPRAESLGRVHQVAARVYDVFWRSIGSSTQLERLRESGRLGDMNVTTVEPASDTGLFDPIKMLDARPGKSRKLLLQGYRDAERALYPESGATGDEGGSAREPGGGSRTARRRPPRR